MKSSTNLYVLLFSLLTSASVVHCMDSQAKILARQKNNTFKTERQDALDQIDTKKYNKSNEGSSHFMQEKTALDTLDARRANSVPNYSRRQIKTTSDLTNPNRVIVGSAAWAAAKTR